MRAIFIIVLVFCQASFTFAQDIETTKPLRNILLSGGYGGNYGGLGGRLTAVTNSGIGITGGAGTLKNELLYEVGLEYHQDKGYLGVFYGGVAVENQTASINGQTVSNQTSVTNGVTIMLGSIYPFSDNSGWFIDLGIGWSIYENIVNDGKGSLSFNLGLGLALY